MLVPAFLWRFNSLRATLKLCLLFGFLSGSGLCLYALGLIYSGIVRATLLFYLTPVWSMLTAWLILRETTDWRSIVAIVCGLLGLALMVGGGDEQSIPFNIGDVLGLCAGVFWAFAIIVLRKNPELPTLSTSTFQFISASLFPLAMMLLLGWTPAPALSTWLDAGWIIGTFSIVVLVPSLFILFYSAGRVPPARAGMLMMSEVIVAIISAALLTNEHLGWLEWLGAVLILCAATYEVLKQDPEKPQPQSRP